MKNARSKGAWPQRWPDLGLSPPLPVPSWVTLGRLLDVFELQVPHLSHPNDTSSVVRKKSDESTERPLESGLTFRTPPVITSDYFY